jgi:regulator of cell morphogenesis and NO signaling
MKDLQEKTVGLIVAEQPLRAAVFDRLNIDYCCGGKRTLSEACASHGINTAQVIAQLNENDQAIAADSKIENWLSASLSDLIDHIQQTHHAYLKTELPRLQELADKVASVHGVREPRLKEVARVFSAMRDEIEQHTNKEDIILFPFIRKLDQKKGIPKAPFGSVSNPVRCMEAEHNDASEALQQLRTLTDQYVAPESACASWVALVAGLAYLEHDLRTHIHKENTILFPRAIAAESALAHE